MRIALVVAILCLVFLLGCIHSEEKPKVFDGIRINKFVIEPKTVREGNNFVVSLEIENTGTVTARNVLVDLYGLSWIPEEFKPWLTYGYDVDYDGDGIPGITLKGVDVTTSPPSPGGMKTIEWEIPAPDYPEGVVHTHTLTARVTYDYSTKTVISIPAVSRDEYERKYKGKGAALEPTVVSNTHSPIQVSVITSGPIVVDPYNPLYPNDVETEYTFRLIFKNTGSGVPSSLIYTPNGAEYKDGFIYGVIRLEGPAYFKDCLGVSENEWYLPNWINSVGYNYMLYSGYPNPLSIFSFWYPGYNTQNYIFLPRVLDFDLYRVNLRLIGDEIEKSCTIAIRKGPCAPGHDPNVWCERKEDTVTLVIDLYYTYYTEAKADITTIGRRGGVDMFTLLRNIARNYELITAKRNAYFEMLKNIEQNRELLRKRYLQLPTLPTQTQTTIV